MRKKKLILQVIKEKEQETDLTLIENIRTMLSSVGIQIHIEQEIQERRARKEEEASQRSPNQIEEHEPQDEEIRQHRKEQKKLKQLLNTDNNCYDIKDDENDMNSCLIKVKTENNSENQQYKRAPNSNLKHVEEKKVGLFAKEHGAFHHECFKKKQEQQAFQRCDNTSLRLLFVLDLSAADGYQLARGGMSSWSPTKDFIAD
ncbi:hypothetical protein FQA39_LY13444 [Lamprigera yunnana]|nr:hypothetical protein FQA39_LY13444 [Lamprigera yunnana]